MIPFTHHFPAITVHSLRTTSTTITCPATGTVGVSLSCSAPVVDTSPGTTSTPTGTVSWTHTNTGTFSAATCSLVSGSCSVQYTPGASGSHMITGNYGGDSTHDTSSGDTRVTVTPFDYELSMSPMVGSTDQGGSTTTTVKATLTGGASESVALSATVSPSEPSIGVSLDPESGSPAFSSHMTVTTLSSTPTGSYTITIKGTSTVSGVERKTMYTLTVSPPPPVPDFKVDASVSSFSFQSGGQGSDGVTVTGLNGFTGDVSLSNSITATGLTVACNPVKITGGSGNAVCTFSSSTHGEYTVTITGTSGSIVRSTNVMVTVTAPAFPWFLFGVVSAAVSLFLILLIWPFRRRRRPPLDRSAPPRPSGPT